MFHLLVALGAGSLAAFWPFIRRGARALDTKLPPAAREALSPVVLTGILLVVYRELAAGNPPTVHDHGFHIYKALELRELLGRLNPFGWSDLEFGGLPPFAHYPLGGAALTAALAALPGVSLGAAHAWSLLVCQLCMTLAVYWAARLHFGRTTATLAGLFALFDPGGWWVGGHFTAIEMGMWIQWLSTALVIASLGLLPAALEKGSPRALLGAGVLVGLATLVHPQALLHTTIVAVPMALAVLATRGVKVGPALARAAAFAGIGLTTCAFWLIFYFAQRHSGTPDLRAPFGVDTIWDRLVKGELFWQPALYFGGGLCGLFLLAVRRDVFSRFLALAIPFAVVFSSRNTLELLHVLTPERAQFIDTLQLERVYFLVRPLGMIATAYGFTWVFKQVQRQARVAAPTTMDQVVRGVGAALVFLFLMMPGLGVPGAPQNPDPQGFNAADLAEYQMALDVAQHNLGPDGRLVLYEKDQLRHEMLVPVAERGIKIFKIGGTAAVNFSNRLTGENKPVPDPELLEHLGGTVLLTRGEPPESMRRFPLLASFGPFQVRRLDPLPRAWIASGPGTVQVLEFNEQEIRVKVDGVPSESSRVVFGMGYYDAWRQENGEPPIKLGVKGGNLPAVPGRNGELVLRYRTPASAFVGLAITLVGIAAIAAWWVLERRRRGGAAVPIPAKADAAPANADPAPPLAPS